MVTRHPVRIVVAWLVILLVTVAGAFWGFGQGGLFDRLDNSVSLMPGSDSHQVNTLAAASTARQLTVVISGVDLATDGADLAQAAATYRARLTALPGVSAVTDPFAAGLSSPEGQARLSDKGDGYVTTVVLDPRLTDQAAADAEAAVGTELTAIQTALREQFRGATLRYTSAAAIRTAIFDQIKADVFHSEALGMPTSGLLMIIVFGGVLAAGLPVLSALAAILIGMGTLWLLTFLFGVEAFTFNVIAVMGESLSIDYALLVVARFREELGRTLVRAGYATDGSRLPKGEAVRPLLDTAMAATLRTAGRAISFSALTIAVAMSAMLTLRANVLRAMGVSAIIVTVVVVSCALTLVPAVIVLLGRFLLRPSVVVFLPGVRRLVAAVADTSAEHGVFSKLAAFVHRRPWRIMVVVALLLATMAAPLGGLVVRFTATDYLTAGHGAADAYHQLQNDYPAFEAPSVAVVAEVAPAATGALVAHLAGLKDVEYVTPPVAVGEGWSLINVHLTANNQLGPAVTQFVRDLRAYDAGYGLLVGGAAALQLDFVDSVVERAPLAIALMGLAVFVLMFFMTGSLIVPLKAMIINALSLLASLGTTTYLFMHGWLGLPRVQGMDTFAVVCTVCFGFGLAMDYEVFLITRVKEFWDAGYDNDTAVERGLQRSGRIITSAAALIVVVFLGFTSSELILVKQVAVALAITVVTDATLVRMLLVPATMTVLGRWNWWAPRPLRHLYGKVRLDDPVPLRAGRSVPPGGTLTARAHAQARPTTSPKRLGGIDNTQRHTLRRTPA
ncbi:MAG: MMPL family transporter [Propionibacteriaceae bacterium]|jgi:RND superfamily putative drug exporter|nr:MMPL family transporter [Propionibacteriaceae bacterium]